MSCEPVDLLVTATCIRSLDPSSPPAEAMAIRDGRVVALGEAELADRFAPAERRDLPGRTVLPGLVDAHVHLLGIGRMRDGLDLRACASWDDVLDAVADALRADPEAAFLVGRGWNHEAWPARELPRHDRLSALAPRVPVLLRRVDGHATLANRAALERAGIAASTPDPLGGEIVRDDRGQPTGLMVDTAADLLPEPPPLDHWQRERALLLGRDALLSAGLTSVHDAGMDPLTLDACEAMARGGRLLLRLTAYLEGRFDEQHAPSPWLRERLSQGPRRSGRSSSRVAVPGVKIYLDGALGSRGAALLEPYADRPGAHGLLQLTQTALELRLKACLDAGMQAEVHAIGDAANRMALDAMERVLGAGAADDHRWRIEHAQVIAPQDLPRFARLGVVASVQPTHATSDREMARARLGEERVRHAYAWRSLLRSGARLALGSDAPIEDVSPFEGLFAACTRRDARGLPPGGWLPEEALTREEALLGFSTWAAWAGFQEHEVGTLAPGRAADFIVLPRNPLTCDDDELRALRPESTWIAGRCAWPPAGDIIGT